MRRPAVLLAAVLAAALALTLWLVREVRLAHATSGDPPAPVQPRPQGDAVPPAAPSSR